jgi:hypothetical protein
MNGCPLVMIEWEDTAQPAPEWMHLATFEAPAAVRRAAVGWMIHDGADVKALAPNLGAIKEDSVQVSGVIHIPARCITRLVELNEPEPTSSGPVPASRPARGRKRRAS